MERPDTDGLGRHNADEWPEWDSEEGSCWPFCEEEGSGDSMEDGRAYGGSGYGSGYSSNYGSESGYGSGDGFLSNPRGECEEGFVPANSGSMGSLDCVTLGSYYLSAHFQLWAETMGESLPGERFNCYLWFDKVAKLN